MRRSPSRLAVIALLPALGCVLGTPSEPSSGGTTVLKGKFGEYYYVNLFTPPVGGVISSDVGGIDCGASHVSVNVSVSPPQYLYTYYPSGSGHSDRCGQTRLDWSQPVTLTATPRDGLAFIGWAGACSGVGTCSLSAGADKSVVAIFGAAGSAHPNYLDPAIHGPAYIAYATGKSVLDCKSCHGQALDGQGLAPSCNACHAATGVSDWQHACTFCHGAPPVSAAHPVVSTALTGCAGCHPGTVDSTGTLVAGGLHLDGLVEAVGGGHAAGFAAPAVHGPEFFAFVSGTGGLACTSCHGADYSAPIASGGQSCNSCHAAAGWSAWQTNCSFCHGASTAAAKAGYTLATQPTWAAPPDAVSQRLGGAAAPDRTGAHALHLTGSAFAGPFACATCHAVPTSAAHVSGRSARAAVVLSGAGQASLPASLGTYDQASGTCATACHGGAPSPGWSTTGSVACGSCHATPPATAAHASVTAGNLTACATCHPGTMNADGSIKVAGGLHLNGLVESTSPHAAGFAAAAQHGARYLDTLGGVAGALDCASCHGASLDSCTSCHSSAAGGSWVSWQTNCTFCHGTKTKTYPGTLSLADPPDAVSQRLTGVAAPSRTGEHARHASQGVGCSSCHVVPTTLAHVGGSTARATVTLSAYNPATGQCAAACHGSQSW